MHPGQEYENDETTNYNYAIINYIVIPDLKLTGQSYGRFQTDDQDSAHHHHQNTK